MDALDRTAPAPPLATRGPLDVLVTLRHYAIVTYAVEPAALAAHLPAGFEPELFTLADGSRRGLVSAVVFVDVGFRLRVLPWPRFSFGQTNYRAYVRHRGERVVWFFGTALATGLVIVPRLLWRMPWHRVRMAVDARWDGERCLDYRLDAAGDWGTAALRCRGSDRPTGVLDGFTSAEETARVLTHPTRGYFRRRGDGDVATYTIDHAPLQLQRAADVDARFTVFESLGLVAAGAAPHSVLLQRASDYAIHLPPRRVAG